MTTRRIVILRHAKAADPDDVADHDRPLTRRGHLDAAAAGAWLARSGYAPELVVCSTARRTRETWQDAAKALGEPPEVRFEARMYAASVLDLLEVLTELDEDVATAALVGHNPAVSQLSALLDPVRADRDGLRTAGLAVHAFDGAWLACAPGTATLAASHTARG